MKKFSLTLICFLISLPALAASVKDVNIVNTPVPVEGAVDVTGSSITVDNNEGNAVPVRPLPDSVPVQFLLRGLFSDGSFNLGSTILGPMSYEIPDGYSKMLLKYVSCRVIQEPGVRVVINLSTAFNYDSSAIPDQEIVKLMTSDARSVAVPLYGTTAVRYAESANVHAWLGITTPGGPEIGNTLSLSAQRSTTTGSGGIGCVVSGELYL